MRINLNTQKANSYQLKKRLFDAIAVKHMARIFLSEKKDLAFENTLCQVLTVEQSKGDNSQFRVRSFLNSDMQQICSWIKNRRTLQLVSIDSSDCLTPDILINWIVNSQKCFVVTECFTDKPVGFCTLSRQEVSNLSYSYVELCHLIVNPQRKYLFIGSILCSAARSVARDLGYQFLCGRVVSTNRYGLVLAKSQRAKEITNMESWATSDFRWFRVDLSNDNSGNNE